MRFIFLPGLLVCGLLLASAGRAQAPPVYVEVGQKKTMSLSKPIASVRSSAPKLLKVSKQGARKVRLVGKRPGRSTVSVRTKDGGKTW